MARNVRIRASQLQSQIKKKTLNALVRNPGLRQVLVTNAKRRIDNSGDSEHKYPELWNPDDYKYWRAGGLPLRDTSALYNGLHGRSSSGGGNRISLFLLDAVGYGIKHQEGYEQDGPVPIALTRKANRMLRKGGIKDLEDTNLKEGKDYIIAWDGVKVPQRKIFNLPPEDRRDIGEALVTAITKMR